MRGNLGIFYFLVFGIFSVRVRSSVHKVLKPGILLPFVFVSAYLLYFLHRSNFVFCHSYPLFHMFCHFYLISCIALIPS